MKFSLKFSIFFLLSLFLNHTTSAEHLVGGEMTYECIGNDTYVFTITVYRDANTGGSGFDGVGAGDLRYTYFKNGEVLFTLGYPFIPQVSTVDLNETNPCAILPPSISLEKAVYQFYRTFTFEEGDVYALAYQRCCLISNATNIINPETYGSTYYVEITQEASESCNSSPEFSTLSSVLFRAGEEMNVDFSGIDPDGDSLVYELCTPFNGGGPDQDNPSSPTGVTPDPETLPPYSAISLSEGYTLLQPLGIGNEVVLNAETGILSGTPMIQGQYMVGVCVKEYKNEVLINETQRQVRLTVTDCISPIEESKEKSPTFSIFPNPAKENIFISFPNPMTGEKESIISFYNQNGKLVRQQKTDDVNSLFLSVANLPKGMYFVKVQQDDVFVGIEKFIIQ